MKKLKELSTQDLLKNLDNPEELSVKEDVQENLDKFSNFLAIFRIKPGKEKVNYLVLLDLYENYYQEYNFKKITFIKTFGQFNFQNRLNYIFINKNTLTIKDKSIKLIENKIMENIKTPGKKRHYENFIGKFDLKKGKKLIPLDCLYHLYLKWCSNNNRTPKYQRGTFDYLTGLYFSKKRISWVDYISLNEDIYNHITKKEINDYSKKKQTPEVRKFRS